MAKKNFYAIKRGKNGVNNLIVTTWSECSKIVLGFNSEYKGFGTREEAEKYLGIGSSEVQEQIGDTKKTVKKKSKKKKSKNTERFEVEIPKDLYAVFSSKCAEFEMSENAVIKNMIKEWVL